VILIGCFSLSAYAAPKDCRKVIDLELIKFAMNKSIPFASSYAKLWCEKEMHPDKENISFFVAHVLAIWVPLLNDEGNVCGVYVGCCLPLSGKSTMSKCIEAIKNQSEFTKYFKISFGSSESGINFLEELEPKLRYWDAKKEKLYKEPHKGCEELLMYIRD
jgi:hypothetical protein